MTLEPAVDTRAVGRLFTCYPKDLPSMTCASDCWTLYNTGHVLVELLLSVSVMAHVPLPIVLALGMPIGRGHLESTPKLLRFPTPKWGSGFT